MALAALNEIRTAWQGNDYDNLFGHLSLAEAGWKQRADLLLSVLQEENENAFVASELASDFFGRLWDSGNTIHADNWRRYVSPRILQLQSGSSYEDEVLVALAAKGDVSSADVLAEPINIAATWLSSWIEDFLQAATEANPAGILPVLLDPVRLIGVSNQDDTLPAIFHPLVLRSLRILLKTPAYAKADQPLSDWLDKQVFSEGDNDFPVSVTFTAGALILDLAKSNGIFFQDNKLDANHKGGALWFGLARSVTNSIVMRSFGDNQAPLSWQGEEARAHARTLFDKCTFWQEKSLAGYLRSLASESLRGKIDELDKSWVAAEVALSPEWFSPGLESAGHIPLPDRRGRLAFHEDPNWNSENDEFTWLLSRLKTKVKDAKTNAGTVAATQDGLSAARELCRGRLASPLARAALLDQKGGLKTQHGNAAHRLTAAFIQRELSDLGLTSTIYNNVDENHTGQALLTHTPAWKDAINPDDTEMLLAWGELEAWDQSRGRFKSDSEEAQTLRAVKSLEWLETNGIPPADADIDIIRRDLAAIVHLVSFTREEYDSLRGQLINIVDHPHPTPEQITVLTVCAAACLELGMTQLTGGAGPASAFPEIYIPDAPNGIASYMNWISLAQKSPNPWEARAGMNGLILLARLADAFDDIVIAKRLNDVLDDNAIALIRKALLGLLSPANTLAAGSSTLPLAFVAADLLRYSRTLARGILIDGLMEMPRWLPITSEAGSPLAAHAGELIRKLEAFFVNAPRRRLQHLSASGGLPVRLLLLSIFQMKLDEYARDRRLVVTAPTRADVEPLSKLRRATRELFCGDEVLSHDWSELARAARKLYFGNLTDEIIPKSLVTRDRVIPWWQTRFWALVTVNEQMSPDSTNMDWKFDPGSEPAFITVNWLQSKNSDPLGQALMTAAALEAAVPPQPPEIMRDDNKDNPVIIQDARFLLDIDGRLEGEFPMYSWKAAREKLGTSITRMKDAESDYHDVLNDMQHTNAMIEWLKSPMRMSTADFRQQIDAAIADLRRAEAELEVAEHESVAAILEEAAHAFIYKAAILETQRQKALVDIGKIDQDIIANQARIAAIDVSIAGNDQKVAGLRVEQAKLSLEKAAKAGTQIQEEIKALKAVLGNPGQGNPAGPEVTKSDGTKVKANGQLAAMALRIEDTYGKKLEDALDEALVEQQLALAEDRKQKRKAKRYKMVTQVCQAIGAAVGAFFGGPAGASLGAEIGAAVAELGIGIAENKPPEDILLGLVDNAFAIANAAGVDLEAELNELGAKGMAEVGKFLDSAEESLGPMLDSLPKVFNEPMVKEAFTAFGLDEVPTMTENAGAIFQDLKDGFERMGSNIEGEGGLGTILEGAARFPDADAFAKNLQQKIVPGVFEELKDNSEAMGILARTLGQDVNVLITNPEAQVAAAKRLSALVVTDMSRQAMEFRSGTVKTWIEDMQKEGLDWAEATVQKQAQQLLDQFFGDSIETRTQVEASLKSALLAPDTKRGEIQKYLRGDFPEPGVVGGWLGELDAKMKLVFDNPEVPAPTGGGSRVANADQQVAYLVNAKTKFNDTLLPFLKGESEARDALLLQLDGLETRLGQAQLDIGNARLGLEAGNIEFDIAGLELDKAKEFARQMELGEKKASLMSRVVELSHLRWGNIEQAERLSKEAASARVEGAKSRVVAARSGLDARKANLEGALRLGAEASRIRAALDRPPMALDISGAMMKTERRIHGEQLESALTAYRELLRFYRSIGAEKFPEVERPDKAWAGDAKTWAAVFNAWLDKVDVAFGDLIVTAKVDEVGGQDGIVLTPRQIQALAGKNGLRYSFRHVDEEPKDREGVMLMWVPRTDQYPTQVGPLSGDWSTAFQIAGIKVDAGDVVDVNTIEIRSFNSVTIETHKWNAEGDSPVDAIHHSWALDELHRFRIVSEDSDGVKKWVVYRIIEGPTKWDDTIIDGVNAKMLSSGRIEGIFLEVKQQGGGLLGGGDYKIRAEHLGDGRFSDKELRLRPRQQSWNQRPDSGESKDARLILLTNQNINIVNTFKERAELANLSGDPDLLAVNGFVLAGTMILRLEALSSKVIDRVVLRLLIKTYTVS